ncbi:hypothetical protein ACFPLB_16385 [Aquamicrobium segne]|uniref:Uncharacterized protein n=1 Tax=Aquamicrobium segne TaxID=469547 RepID=A0ABW0H3Z0_9HYPH
MLRDISEDMRIKLKDRLREMHHTLRAHRHDHGGPGLPFLPGGQPPFPLPEIEGLIGRAISLFDNTITVATTLAPYDDSTVRPRPLDAYFDPDGDRHTSQRAFRRDMYYLTKALLARFTITSRPIQEADFASVHTTMLRQHKNLLRLERRASCRTHKGRSSSLNEHRNYPKTDSTFWSDAPTEDKNSTTQKIARLASLCAALTAEFLRVRPVQPLTHEGNAPLTFEAKNRLTILIIASLALGLALASADPEPETDLLDMAALAIEARLERIICACHASDPISELTPIFAMLIFLLR